MTSKIRQLVLGLNRIDKELSIYAVKIGYLIEKRLGHNLSNIGCVSENKISPFPVVYPTNYIEQRSDIMEINARLIAHDFHLN